MKQCRDFRNNFYPFNFFLMATKKFALNNSYFKNIRYQPKMPQTPIEIMRYRKEKWELPYNAEPTWERVYEMFCEYQKRNGVCMDQFLTPPKVAYQFAWVREKYWFRWARILEIWCGTWMITRYLIDAHVVEKDPRMIEICKLQDIEATYWESSFDVTHQDCYDFVIWNPPYEPLQQVLAKTHELLKEWWRGIMILPVWYFQKERPKALVETLNKFTVEYVERSCAEFDRTKIQTEIVVFRKI